MTLAAPPVPDTADESPWFQNEALWDGFFGMMFSERRADRARQTVRTSPFFRYEPGTRILDLCCGPGIYLVPLAESGYAVTGVDLSPAMVAEARRKRNAAGVSADIIEGNMLHYAEDSTYDVVVNLSSSFGYFDDESDNLQVLENIYRSLRPGGQLIIEVYGKEFLASRDLDRPQVVDLDSGPVYVRNTVHHDWSRLRTDWTSVGDNGVRSAFIDSHLYSAVELKALLRASGFTDIECFGGFDARPYDLGSKTLIARATRPAADPYPSVV